MLSKLIIYDTPGRLRCSVPGCMNFAKKGLKKKAGPVFCICDECLSEIGAAYAPKPNVKTDEEKKKAVKSAGK